MDKNYYEEFVESRYIKKPYNINQYDDLVKENRFFFREQVSARYIIHDLKEYNVNILTRALPPIYSIEQLIDLLEKRPQFSEDELNLPAHLREHAIYRINTDCLFILKRYVDLYKQLMIVLYRSLITKKIMNPDFIRTINHNSDILSSNKKNKVEYLKSISSGIEGGAAGFSIIGISGGGKTTSLNNVLSLLPQCIVHSEENGYIFKQITYVKIDCSHDGSLKGIAINFIKEVDSILNSNYYEKHVNSRISIDYLIALVGYITQIHAVGVVVVDEIQHLSNSRINAEKALNFFVTLQNKLKVPIIYCGTYKAIKQVLGQDYRQARRASGIGEIHWSKMKQDREYNIFMRKLWTYQWVKKRVELSQEVLDVFYEKTMGITDRIVKLFMAVQLEAIISREEKISIKLIKKVADTQLVLTKPMINALKSGNISRMDKYDDLYSVDFDTLQSKYNRQVVESEVEQNKENEEFIIVQRQKEIEYQLTSYLKELDMDKEQVQVLVNTVVDKFGYDKSVSVLKNEAIRLYCSIEDGQENSSLNNNDPKEKSLDFRNQGLVKDEIS